ncbi:class I SAM-dependent methyltransferase [Paenibacillus sp. J2TS4]|uniref:class I SAM-dependent methyltransferase n=1 Tax=Paenibacillus sp. J2TS4 TaxID=2807194 RepID=UPI001B1064CC|nr:SAM-dependent methyltransferase [Paenibacillus sp. J2TS4]GIP36376.1 SAM-dependent methyltransferase [Paenibacillus sp. J2TS4]
MQNGNLRLIDWIRSRMSEGPHKAISFKDYMKECLYHPEYGYYMSDKAKIGKDGDFYTSASVGGIMGIMMARLLSKLSRQWQGRPIDWVEWGGGEGQLAKQILDEVQQSNPGLYKQLTYIVVEKSRNHSQSQKERLAPHSSVVRFMDEEQWWREGSRKQTIILSNELLDAFPVHRVRRFNGRVEEQWVYWDEGQERLASCWQPAADPRLVRYLKRENIHLSDGQTAEINLEADDWIRLQAARLEEGSLVTVDYGDLAEELYSPHRMNGTLMCYRNHAAMDQPLEYPGEQDLTAHVNFTACIRAGVEEGIEEWNLMTQKQFLVEQGILELLQNHSGSDPFGPEARRNRAVRQLLLSDQMSELFKVLIQTKKGDRN